MNNKTAVRDMPLADQPLYRADQFGVAGLNNAELIQLICRNHYFDANMQLMARAGSLKSVYHMSSDEIAETDGLGKSAAIALQASFELGRRLICETEPNKATIRSPGDAASVLMPQFGHCEQEHFIVMFLDTRNRVIGTEVLYKGTINASQIRIAEIFKGAIKRNALRIVIAHNHPSGDPTPSPEQVQASADLPRRGKKAVTGAPIRNDLPSITASGNTGAIIDRYIASLVMTGFEAEAAAVGNLYEALVHTNYASVPQNAMLLAN